MHFVGKYIHSVFNSHLTAKLCAVFISGGLSLSSVNAFAIDEAADAVCNGSSAFGSLECWYVGGGVGMSHIDPSPISIPSYRLDVTDDANTSLKAFAGFTFSKHWFAEFTYENLAFAELTYGPQDLSSTTIQDTSDYFMYSASGGYWLRGRTQAWDVFIKAGYSRVDSDETVVELDENLLSLGLGAEWRISPKWFARAEYTYYDKDATSLGLSIGRYFGGRYKKTKKIMPKSVAPVEAVVEAVPAPVEVELDEIELEEVNLDLDDDGVSNDDDACPGSPIGSKVDSRGCPLLDTITLNVQFDTSQSLIKSEYSEEIERVSGIIKDSGEVHVTVEGHTDWQGKQSNNQILSESRAQAVAEALIEESGLSMDNFTIVGFGELKPIADNTTPEGRYKNRRVMVVISEK